MADAEVQNRIGILGATSLVGPGPSLVPLLAEAGWQVTAFLRRMVGRLGDGVELLLGKRDMAQRLCGSLPVDIFKARTLLGWPPSIGADEGLRRTAQGFLHETVV